MRPGRPLGGSRMELDLKAARDLFKTLGSSMNVTAEEAAVGALQVQKFGMTQAIEQNSVRRGYDPRDFTLVAAGGAGALFACEIASELEVPKVLVPASPGIIAAIGLLATDETYEYVATERFKFDEANTASIQNSYEHLETQAVARLDSESISDDRRKIEWLADARYEGQGYEVRFSVPKGKIDDQWLTQVEQAFHAAHLEEFGHKFENGTVEVINIRVDASA